MKTITIENIQLVLTENLAQNIMVKKLAPGMYDLHAENISYQKLRAVLSKHFEGLIMIIEEGYGKFNLHFSKEVLDDLAPKVKEKTGTSDPIDKIKLELFLQIYGHMLPDNTTNPTFKSTDDRFSFNLSFRNRDGSLN